MNTAKIAPNPELERATLACVLQGFPSEDLGLVEADFLDARHRAIWRALAVAEKRDLLGLHAALAATHGLDAVGGGGYLAGLLDLDAETASAPVYAKSLRELRVRFDMAAACKKLAAAAETPSESRGEDLLGQMAYTYGELERLLTTGDRAALTGLEATIAEYEATAGARELGQLLGISTGFRAIDDVLQGFEPGRLVVIAGRPGMGKSGLLDDFALFATLQIQASVGIWSLEMPRAERHKRWLAKLCSIDHSRIRSGRISDRERPKIATANRQLLDAGLRINDRPGLTFPQIIAEVRREHRRKPLAWVAIDHLGRLKFERPADKRYMELGDIARAAKNLAMELMIPVIAICQLNREPEKRTKGRPQLSDLRDSGEIEQEADVVAFVYREEKYAPTVDNRGTAELIVAKNRGGAEASIPLRFIEQFVRFDNY